MKNHLPKGHACWNVMNTDVKILSGKKATAESQIQEYLDEPLFDNGADPLFWWKENSAKFPSMAKLASRYLATQSSSAPVKRLFSVCGNIFCPNRCSLADSTFQRLTFIKVNKDFKFRHVTKKLPELCASMLNVK